MKTKKTDVIFFLCLAAAVIFPILFSLLSRTERVLHNPYASSSPLAVEATTTTFQNLGEKKINRIYFSTELPKHARVGDDLLTCMGKAKVIPQPYDEKHIIWIITCITPINYD